MTLRTLLAAVALTAPFLVPAGAGAQADTLGVSTALWTACPGAQVRLALNSGETMQGRCGPAVDGRLLVRMRNDEQHIHLVDVDSLWIRRSFRNEATLLFAVLGAAVGAITGGEVERCTDPRPCTVQYELGTAERAGVGAVAGAAFGVLAGPFVTRWRRRFP